MSSCLLQDGTFFQRFRDPIRVEMSDILCDMSKAPSDEALDTGDVSLISTRYGPSFLVLSTGFALYEQAKGVVTVLWSIGVVLDRHTPGVMLDCHTSTSKTPGMTVLICVDSCCRKPWEATSNQVPTKVEDG